MRRDDLAPGLAAPPVGCPSIGATADLARFAARLLLEAEAQHFLLLALDLARLCCGRDSGQQPLDAVERSVGVVDVEGLLVRPVIARVA